MTTKSDFQYSNKQREYFASSRFDVQNFVPIETSTILDVGMGEGNFLEALKKDRPEIEAWGIELEKQSFNKAKNKIDKALEGTIEDNLTNLPDNYFDCITFNDVIEHLVDPVQTLKSIKLKLKDDGVLIASIPNMRYIFNMKKIILDLIFKKDWRYYDSGIMDKTHLHFYTKLTMQELLSESGFELIKIEGTNSYTNWKLKFLNLITFNHFEDCQFVQFILVAKKS
jgi:2-polyprenyl-3-methyl-5-hydroxy-6-metoxy-1,4-benzoquinol methylase